MSSSPPSICQRVPERSGKMVPCCRETPYRIHIGIVCLAQAIGFQSCFRAMPIRLWLSAERRTHAGIRHLLYSVWFRSNFLSLSNSPCLGRVIRLPPMSSRSLFEDLALGYLALLKESAIHPMIWISGFRHPGNAHRLRVRSFGSVSRLRNRAAGLP